MRYKVDIDIAGTRTWRKYLRWLRFSLLRLYEGGTVFEKCRVFKTKHGYHLYFYDRDGFRADDFANLIECLLGGDINRQLYFYAESEDILFKEREELDKGKSSKVNKLIHDVNRRKPYIRKIIT